MSFAGGKVLRRRFVYDCFRTCTAQDSRILREEICYSDFYLVYVFRGRRYIYFFLKLLNLLPP